MSSTPSPVDDGSVDDDSVDDIARSDPGAGNDQDTADMSAADTAAGATATAVERTYTARFVGFVLLFGLAVAVAAATLNPAAVAASVILLTFVLAGVLQRPPTPSLAVSYHLSSPHPRPEDAVTVTVTVENTGAATLADVRFVDTVPDELRVVDGSPRATGPLRSGETRTFSYEVTARRGSYTFGPLAVRTRSLAGTTWQQRSVAPATTATMRCAVLADHVPVEDRAAHFIGGLLSDEGGEGLEFHSTREYRRGDAVTRVNWRELAKRNELSTITYRQEQAAEITLVVDARAWTRVSADAGTPSGAILSAYAAYQLTATLTDEGHYVSVAVPGLDPGEDQSAATSFPYRRLERSRGGDQQHRVFGLIGDIEASLAAAAEVPEAGESLRPLGTGSFVAPTGDDDVFDVAVDGDADLGVDEFARDLSAWSAESSQFILVTPLLDPGAHSLCIHLQGMGHSVVVISPDVTDPTEADGDSSTPPRSTVPVRTLGLQRSTRVESLRQRGLTVIDWHPSTPLATCCEKQTISGGR